MEEVVVSPDVGVMGIAEEGLDVALDLADGDGGKAGFQLSSLKRWSPWKMRRPLQVCCQIVIMGCSCYKGSNFWNNKI